MNLVAGSTAERTLRDGFPVQKTLKGFGLASFESKGMFVLSLLMHGRRTCPLFSTNTADGNYNCKGFRGGRYLRSEGRL